MIEKLRNIKNSGLMVTFILILANVLLFLLSEFDEDILYNCSLISTAVLDGEYYRLLTCMFFHFGISHLVSNMIGLYGVGTVIERNAGPAKMLIIYFVSGLAGSVGAFLISDVNTYTVGASGAIFGCFGASLVYLLKNRVLGSARGLFICLAINLVETFTNTGISVGGHIGGLIAGLILGLILFRNEGYASC